MVPLIILGVLLGLPLLLALIFRVSAVMMFLGVAGGALLERSMGGSLELLLNMVFRNESATYAAHIALLALPVILVLIFLRKSAKGSQLLLDFVPLVATCVAFAVLLLPLLPPDLQKELYAQPLGATLKQSTDLAIAVAATANLILALLEHKRGHGGKHH